jgi:selenocysteine-specific elongation factor
VQKGDRAAINIIGIKAEDFERGMLLCDKQLETTEMVDAYITMFDNAPPLDIWTNITFISGTFETPARMHLLNADLLTSGDDAIVQLHLIKPGILLNKDKFIIRNSSADVTLGGGQIIDASPLHHKKRTPKLVEELELLCMNTLTGNSTSEDISTVLKREFRPFTIEEIANKLNISIEDVRSQLTENQSNFSIYQSNTKELFISNICENTFIKNILKAIDDHHQKNPIIAGGLDINELAGKLGLTSIKTGKMYLELLLEKLKNLQNIEQYQNSWIKKGHKPIIDEKTQKQINFLEKLIKDFGDEKPVYQEIEASCQSEGINKQYLRLLMTYLANHGKIKYFNNDFIHMDIYQSSKAIILKALINNNGVLHYQNFKEVLPCTKKMRILLGDIFEFEKIISIVHGQDIETRIELTQKGKEYIDANLS